MRDQAHTTTKTCPQCKSTFLCESSLDGTCWCHSYPSVFEVNPKNECLCKPCLQREVVEKMEQFVSVIDSAQVSDMNLTKYQTLKNIEGIDYYIEEGNYVFTKWYHLKRGSCCESGCRHCPYGFIKSK